MNATAVRLSAEERREEVIAAAMKEFAIGGYAGTSTQDIANRVGVSQPYLFQLFGTKRDLFIAVIQQCFRRATDQFESVAHETRKSTDDPIAILHTMGLAYCDMLADRDMLRLQMQAYAACDDPEIQRVVRAEWTALYDSVKRVSGAEADAIHVWFAEGMLMNVAAAVGGLNPEIEAKLKRGAF